MGLLDIFGGGNDTQTTTQEPWAELQPYLTGQTGAEGELLTDDSGQYIIGPDGQYLRSGATQDISGILPEALSLYEQGPSEFYSGQTYAGFDPLQEQSQQMGVDYAQSGLGGILDPTMSSFQNAVSGGLMSPDSNPYMQQTIQSMADQVKENMALSGISQNEDAAQAAGQYGSARHGLADYLTRKNANEVIARNTNDMLMGGYNTGLNAMMGSMQMAPQMAELGMAPSNLMNRIGGERQAMDQMGITEDVNRFNYNQDAPWQNLSRYSSALQGNYMGSGGQTTSPVTGSSPAAGILGGATAGAGLMQALGSTNPWIAGGGAVLGLLGSR